MAEIPGWTFNKASDPSFRYDDGPHEYHCQGVRLWSPTGVFKQVGYSNNDYYTEEHRYRGQYVHWCLRLLNEGTLNWNDIASEFRGYVEAYAECINDKNLTVRLFEVPLYHPTRLFGVTPDAEVLYQGLPTILEVKTGTMMWWTALQTAAQEEAVRAWDAAPSFRRRFGLELKKTGKYKFKEFDDPDDYDTWHAALKTCQRIGEPPRKLNPEPIESLMG